MRILLRPPRAEVLSEILRMIRSTELGGVCVSGEAGSGMSTILEQLEQTLRAESNWLIGAYRLESHEESPLLPWASLLGQIMEGASLRITDLDSLLERVPAGQRSLARALGRWSLAVGGLQGAGSPGTWLRLSQYVSELEVIRLELQRRPEQVERGLVALFLLVLEFARTHNPRVRALLLLDQLELAGRTLRQLLTALMALPPEQCAVAVGWCDTYSGLTLPCPDPVRGLPRVQLEPLTELEARALLLSWSGSSQLPPSVESGLAQLCTKGEINLLALRMLVLSRHLGRAFEPGFAGMRSLLLHQLASLPVAARDLLGLLSLMPSPLSLETRAWADLLGIEPSSVSRLLSNLDDLGLLRARGGRVSLSYRPLPEVVRELLSEDELISLSARLLHFLSSQQARALEEPVSLPHLAAFNSAQQWVSEQAEWLMSTATLAQTWYQFGGWEPAERHTATLLNHLHALESRSQAQVLNLAASVASALERWDAASALLEDAIACISPLEQGGADLAHLLSSQGRVALELRDYARARALCAKALTWAHEHDPTLERSLLRLLALVHVREGLVAEAAQLLEPVAIQAQQAGAMEDAATLWWECAELLMVLGELERCDHLLDQAQTCQSRLPRAPSHVSLLARRALVAELLGHSDRARAYWQAGLEAAAEDGQRSMHWCILTNDFACFLSRSGDVQAAEKCFERLLIQIRSLGDERLEAVALSNLSISRADLEHSQWALEDGRRSLYLMQRQHNLRGSALAANNLGTLLYASGHHDQAIAAFQESLAALRSVGASESEATVLNNLATVYAQSGALDRALNAFRGSLAIREGLSDLEGQRTTLVGMLQALEGGRRYSRAEACLQRLMALQPERTSEWPPAARAYAERLTQKARCQPPVAVT